MNEPDEIPVMATKADPAEGRKRFLIQSPIDSTRCFVLFRDEAEALLNQLARLLRAKQNPDHVEFETTHQVARKLQSLADSGYYGIDTNATAEMLLRERLRQIINGEKP